MTFRSVAAVAYQQFPCERHHLVSQPWCLSESHPVLTNRHSRAGRGCRQLSLGSALGSHSSEWVSPDGFAARHLANFCPNVHRVEGVRNFLEVFLFDVRNRQELWRLRMFVLSGVQKLSKSPCVLLCPGASASTVNCLGRFSRGCPGQAGLGGHIVRVSPSFRQRRVCPRSCSGITRTF